LGETEVIFRQNITSPGGKHFGSRLVFDRTGNLFVTTGDRDYLRDRVQDPSSHIGKILRIDRDGSAAIGNPNKDGWAAEVWSLGHRNVQGACLHPETGELWTAEHGARGGDEINTPQSGKNYGWPVITYGRDYDGSKIGVGTKQAGMEQPVHYWDPSIAPAGMLFYTGNAYPDWTGSLFVTALRGKHIARLMIKGAQVNEQRLFQGFARFRDIAQSSDGHLYVVTDQSSPAGGIYRLEI
jgi:aldose sugar dehydrogenase